MLLYVVVVENPWYIGKFGLTPFWGWEFGLPPIGLRIWLPPCTFPLIGPLCIDAFLFQAKMRPLCARCRNHGIEVNIKGHKRARCPFLNCHCHRCQLNDKRRRINIRKRQVAQHEEQRNGVDTLLDNLKNDRLLKALLVANHNDVVVCYNKLVACNQQGFHPNTNQNYYYPPAIPTTCMPSLPQPVLPEHNITSTSLGV